MKALEVIHTTVFADTLHVLPASHQFRLLIKDDSQLFLPWFSAGPEWRLATISLLLSHSIQRSDPELETHT